MKLKDKKKELNKLIRKYFLLNSVRRDDGKYLCPLKKKWKDESKMHVAHFIDRNRNATRFEKDNLLLVSEESNTYDAMIPDDDYKNKHIRDYSEFIGKERVEYLNQLSEEYVILHETSYDNYIELYKILINKIS